MGSINTSKTRFNSDKGVLTTEKYTLADTLKYIAPRMKKVSAKPTIKLCTLRQTPIRSK